MHVIDLIAKTGTAAALSRKLGVSQQTIQNWKRGGIPEVRQAWIREKWPESAQAAQDRAESTNPPAPG